MTAQISPTPADIRAYRAENAKLRERDIAANLGISEAALVAAEVGLTATRIDPHPNRLLERVKELGEVMALTRNESAVHEKIGEFETIKIADHVSLTLGENMDMRIFNTVWAHGFAVTKKDGDNERLSLQYFDKAGDAVFKLHLRPTSNVDAYRALVADLCLDDQSQDFTAETLASSRLLRRNAPCRPVSSRVTCDSRAYRPSAWFHSSWPRRIGPVPAMPSSA